jgi:hypothetical protein
MKSGGRIDSKQKIEGRSPERKYNGKNVVPITEIQVAIRSPCREERSIWNRYRSLSRRLGILIIKREKHGLPGDGRFPNLLPDESFVPCILRLCSL